MTRQRGVALILALVVVALATTIATRIGAQGARDQRRNATLNAQQQAFQIALGAEAWAAEILIEDVQRGSQRDSLDEVWATPIPGLPIDGGYLQGTIEDMQGRFNLNNLVRADGTPDPIALAQFERILAALQLEPKWASLIVDWIDGDTVAVGPDGAEDGVYSGLTPPYLAANKPLTSTSELLALPGFGADRYRRLAPYVAALPAPTKINVCTASGLVLDSLAPGVNVFSQSAKQLAENRLKGCFPLVADIQAAMQSAAGAAQIPYQAADVAQEKTSWFRIATVVSIGTTQFRLYSLLERNIGGYSRTVLRTFGTE